MADQPSPAASGAPTVFIATPMYGGMATAAYTWSLAATPAAFLQSQVGLLYQYRMNDALVANARNNLADDFLGTPATHLMWIDADIGFNAIDIVSMIVADQDIICGMYPLKAINWERVARAAHEGVPAEELNNHVGFFSVSELDGGNAANADGLVEIEAGGTGFMLIKREVLEALADEVPSYIVGGKSIKEFYTTGIDPETSQLVSEDYYFCRLARSRGFKVHVAPWVRLTHTGPYVYESQLEPKWLVR